MYRLKSVLLLLLSLLTMTGCQPVTPPVSPSAVVPQPPETTEEPDLGCSFYYFLSGRYAELSLNFEEALEAYQKALICDPEAMYIAGKIPILLIRVDRQEEAIDWLESFLATHPADRNFRMLLARILVRQKDYQGAARQYWILQEQDPMDTTPLILLSEIYQARGLTDQAEATLKKVLDMDPGNYAAMVLLARMYRQNRPQDALTFYRQAREANWTPDLLLETAELLVEIEEYDEAASIYREILHNDDGDEDARIALVHVLLLQNKEDEALGELNRLKELTEEPQRVDLTIARLYARKKQFHKAASVLEQLLEREELSQARYLLAIVYFQIGDNDEALSQLRLIGNKAEEYEDALFLQARVLRTMDRSDEAVALLEEAINDSETRTPEMFSMLASLYQIQGMDEKGTYAFTRGLSAFPADDNLLYEYGLFLEQSGKHGEALAVMQQVIAMEPDNAGALNFVGYTWADTKVHLDEALAYIKRAAELQPDNGYIRDSLGWVHFRLGNLDLALEHLLAAIQLSPDDFAIYDHLGDVHLARGEAAKAKQAYAKAIELAGDEEERAPIRKKLGILREQEEQ